MRATEKNSDARKEADEAATAHANEGKAIEAMPEGTVKEAARKQWRKAKAHVDAKAALADKHEAEADEVEAAMAKYKSDVMAKAEADVEADAGGEGE